MHKTALRILVLTLAGAFLFGLGYVAGSVASTRSGTAITASLKDVASCVNDGIELIKPNKIQYEDLSSLAGLCYRQLTYQGYINDFELRRAKFQQQYSADPIILWMVVLITMSGVIFAGLQMLASYRLAVLGKAEFAQSGEMALEANRISLKSSVTGLLILGISLAFFFIFVKYVYKIDELQCERGAQPAAVMLQPGGIGAAHPPSTNESERK